MSIHRRAAKRDANEPEIINALTQAGATVWQLSGAGIPDLLVGFRGTTYLIDVKNLGGRGQRLTDDQKTFFEDWRGGKAGIAMTIGEALRFICAVEPEWRAED